jgi:hypothetical protein
MKIECEPEQLMFQPSNFADEPFLRNFLSLYYARRPSGVLGYLGFGVSMRFPHS